MHLICEDILKQDHMNFSLEDMRKWRLAAIKQTFEWHYLKCKEYRAYCDLHETTPEHIKTYADIAKIQPVPSDAYRESDELILSVPRESITEILTTSSTTSPKPVKFAFDKESYERMGRFQGAHYRKGYGIEDTCKLLYLTPSDKESDTGLVKGSLAGWVYTGFARENISFAVENKQFRYDKCIKTMNEYENLTLYGPPFAHLSLVEHIEKEGIDIQLGKDARIITTGGWKGVAGQISKEDLRKKEADIFKIKETQLRDGYGTSDMMCMLPECECHRKHVPAWINISIREPSDITQEVPDGEKGMTVLMSSVIQSYPAFTMPGDLGIRWEGKCECGKTGQTMEILGRAKGLGSRGCALRLMEFMDIITKD
jgi:long-chain-fatty-acid---luciferin-component ligase